MYVDHLYTFKSGYVSGLRSKTVRMINNAINNGLIS